MPGLVDKLGDNKVMIRQLSMQGLRGVGRIMKPQVLLSLLLPHLASPKWHTREEILNFVIITFLESAQSGNPSFVKEVDYRELLESVTKLLGDDKPKVVQMVLETCATVSHIGSSAAVLDIICGLVDPDTFARLRDRIQAHNIPTLTPEGGLELPHIANELTTQNSFFAAQKGGAVNTSAVGGYPMLVLICKSNANVAGTVTIHISGANEALRGAEHLRNTLHLQASPDQQPLRTVALVLSSPDRKDRETCRRPLATARRRSPRSTPLQREAKARRGWRT